METHTRIGGASRCRCGRRGANAAFTLPETLIAGVVSILLLLILLTILRQHRNKTPVAATSQQPVIVAALRQIEDAKALYSTDRQLRDGETVTMPNLVQGGYLKRTPTVPNIRFIVGVVGAPVTFAFEKNARIDDRMSTETGHIEHR